MFSSDEIFAINSIILFVQSKSLVTKKPVTLSLITSITVPTELQIQVQLHMTYTVLPYHTLSHVHLHNLLVALSLYAFASKY